MSKTFKYHQGYNMSGDADVVVETLDGEEVEISTPADKTLSPDLRKVEWSVSIPGPLVPYVIEALTECLPLVAEFWTTDELRPLDETQQWLTSYIPKDSDPATALPDRRDGADAADC